MTASRKRRNNKLNNASDKSNSVEIAPIIQQNLSKALDTVYAAKVQTQTLHTKWRAHLYRMSLLTGIIAIHQCHTVMREYFNDSTGSELQVHSILELTATSTILLKECLCEILNVAAVFALFKFLTITNPHGNFSSPSFMVSSILVMSSIAAFYASQSSGLKDSSELIDEDNNQTERQLPIACIFHVIVAVCYWFMDVGISKCNQSIQAVKDCEKELKAKKIALHNNKTK